MRDAMHAVGVEEDDMGRAELRGQFAAIAADGVQPERVILQSLPLREAVCELGAGTGAGRSAGSPT